MLLRDSHAAPVAARRALAAYRGVKKILEPVGPYPCAEAPASPPERAASLPSSPALSRRASLEPRRASCESGIFSVANEEECRSRGAACPCSLAGCARCWWWRRGEGGGGGERARLCAACVAAYERALEGGAAPDAAHAHLCGRSGEEGGERHVLARCCCRAPSLYTDSSDEAASLPASEEDGARARGRSAQISRIVEYFERRGGAARRLRRPRPPRPPPAVCEGAVRSKLPLFDARV